MPKDKIVEDILEELTDSSPPSSSSIQIASEEPRLHVSSLETT
jgi:hypothetical protein